MHPLTHICTCTHPSAHTCTHVHLCAPRNSYLHLCVPTDSHLHPQTHTSCVSTAALELENCRWHLQRREVGFGGAGLEGQRSRLSLSELGVELETRGPLRAPSSFGAQGGWVQEVLQPPAKIPSVKERCGPHPPVSCSQSIPSTLPGPAAGS